MSHLGQYIRRIAKESGLNDSDLEVIHDDGITSVIVKTTTGKSFMDEMSSQLREAFLIKMAERKKNQLKKSKIKSYS